MRSVDDNLMRFVRRVHRRLVVARALERSGACLGVASIFACAFASIALFQGRDAMQLVLPTIACGAVVGMIWGLVRRPTRFDAIVEADRQLSLDDLLATAYARRASDDPWERAVVAIGDDRCRALAPAAVVVHRYGGRAWGGIGLSAALGLTLALLSGVPQDSRARATANPKLPPVASAKEMAESPQSQQWDASSAAAEARAKIAAAESRAGIGSESPATHDAAASRSDNEFAHPGNDDGGGGGERAGQTRAAAGDATPLRPAAGATGASADAITTAGGGAATADINSGKSAGSVAGKSADSSAGKSAGTSPASTPKPPPWSSPSWDADRAAAGEAVHSGRVPDAYRDVISEYFRDARNATDDAPPAAPVSPR